MLPTVFEDGTPWGPSTVALPPALVFAFVIAASKYCVAPSVRRMVVEIGTGHE